MERYKEPNVNVMELELDEKNYKRYHGYFVSCDGKIYNKKGHRMSYVQNKLGTWVCSLVIEGKRKTIPVNRIIWEAWRPDMDISKCRVISSLNNNWLIDNGQSDEPDFNLYDLYLVPLTEGGKKPKRSYIRAEIKEVSDFAFMLDKALQNDDWTLVEVVKEKLESMLGDE